MIDRLSSHTPNQPDVRENSGVVMNSVPRITSFVGDEVDLGESQFEYVRASDGKLIGHIVEAGVPRVEAAVKVAKGAFSQHRQSPIHQRVSWLKKAAAALGGHVEEFASLICEDVGKPIRVARGEVRRGADFLETTASALTFTQRHPYGVVAGITPFNVPINLLIQKVAPAMAAGNAIIAKPAPAAARTAVLVEKLFCNAGWPKGLFSVLTGDKATASLLVQHPDVRMVSFTGGTSGGDALARIAGSKRFSSELGSNAANVVFADAEIGDAAKKIEGAAFEASGQQYISAQRVLVESHILPTFLQKFVAAAEALKVGPAEDPATDIGPMVSAASADRVVTMCEDAIASGARYALEPRRNGCGFAGDIGGRSPNLSPVARGDIWPHCHRGWLRGHGRDLTACKRFPLRFAGRRIHVCTIHSTAVFARFRLRLSLGQRGQPVPFGHLPIRGHENVRFRPRGRQIRD